MLFWSCVLIYMTSFKRTIRTLNFSKQSECFYSFAQSPILRHTENSHRFDEDVGTKVSLHATITRWPGLFHSEYKSEKTATRLGGPKIASNEENVCA